jgi:flagellar M-ring protein FliF
LSLRVKRISVVAIALILIAALVLSIWLNSEEYVAIYTELPEYELTEIEAQLSEMGVDVRFDSAGRIMVPKKQEAAVRMQLATAGYPKNGFNYWVIDENDSMLTTDYSRRQANYRQFQERIGAGIKTLDGVKDAIVTIFPPSETAFYLQEESPVTASVLIHMHEGRSLTQNQVTGIQHYVVTAVQGLTAENITIIDGQGNELLGGSSAFGGGSSLAFKQQYENDIRQKVVNVLSGIFPVSDMRVAVTADVNTNPSVTDRTTYFPSPDGDNTGVVSRESDSSESYRSTETDGGVPGTDENSQVPVYPTGGYGGESESAGASSETEFKVSEERTRTLSNGDVVESVAVAVAVNREAFAPGEAANLVTLVATAANVPPENVTVQNYVFYSDEPEPEEPEPEGMNRYLLFGIIAGAVLLAALIVLLLLMRRRRKAAEAAAAAEAEAAAAAAAAEAAIIEYDEEGRPILPHDVDIGPITPMRDKRREEIQEFARQNPEITAQMIKTLLKSEDG